MLAMKGCRTIIFLIALIMLPAAAAGEPKPRWYAGQWDSTIYNRAERPRTVGLRIKIVDVETGMPLSGAGVALKGQYLEERIGTSGDEVGIPYQPQQREFELEAVTAEDGVVVFALSWQKKHPWSFGRPEPKKLRGGGVSFYDVHTSWIRAVDDIEKVQRIEIRHPRYRFARLPFDFDQLLEFGQNKRSELQQPHIFDKFESAWQREMKRPYVKFCVLDLGTKFPDFQNKKSTRVEFFKKIRDKDFGTVYTKPVNWFSLGEHPQSECGPYFVYLLEFPLVPRAGQIDVHIYEAEPAPEEEWEEEEEEEEERERVEEEEAPVEEEEVPEEAPVEEEEETRAPEEEEAEEEEYEEEEEEVGEADIIGISVQTLTSSKRKEMGLPLGVTGVVVTYVESSSAADDAGIETGQVIYAIDHRAVEDESDYQDKIDEKEAGDQFSISVWRKRKGEWERDTKMVRLPD